MAQPNTQNRVDGKNTKENAQKFGSAKDPINKKQLNSSVDEDIEDQDDLGGEDEDMDDDAEEAPTPSTKKEK